MEIRLEKFIEKRSQVDNLTHFSLAMSNRISLILVGLCSLVESALYTLAQDEENNQSFKLNDIHGMGIPKLQTYLSKTGRVNFSEINSWCKFRSAYEIRNVFIHSYGGLVHSQKLQDKAQRHMQNLGFDTSLIGGRIRLTIENLKTLHEIFHLTLESLKIK